MKRKTKITQFTESTIDLLKEEIQATLAALGEKRNVRFTLSGLTYYPDANRAKVTVHFAANAADGSVIDQAREDWNRYVKNYSYCLKPEWLDQTFTVHGETLKITGLLPHRRSMPVKLLRLRDNQERIASPEFVRDGMKASLKDDVREEKSSADVLASRGEGKRAA